MNIQTENDFVIKLKTPNKELITDRIKLGQSDGNSSRQSCNHKSRSSPSSSFPDSYTDSFDKSSPEPGPVNEAKTIQSSLFAPTKVQKSNLRSLKNQRNKNKFGNGTIKRKKAFSFNNAPAVLHRNDNDNLCQTLMQESQLKINELMSDNTDLRRQLMEKDRELKTIQSMNKIQEKHISRITSEEAELPMIIRRYQLEIRSLKQQLKNQKDKYDACEKRTSQMQLQIHKLNRKIERFQGLCESKKLLEKEELQDKIVQLTEDIKLERKRIQDLSKAAELASKKHNYELGIEASKYRELKANYQSCLDECAILRSTLTEKSKILEMQNIYSKRINRKVPPFKLKETVACTNNSNKNKVNDLNKSISLPKYNNTDKRNGKGRNSRPDSAKIKVHKDFEKNAPDCLTKIESKDKTTDITSEPNQNVMEPLNQLPKNECDDGINKSNDKKSILINDKSSIMKPLYYGNYDQSNDKIVCAAETPKKRVSFQPINQIIDDPMQYSKTPLKLVKDQQINDKAREKEKQEILSKLKEIDLKNSKAANNFKKQTIDDVILDIQKSANETDNGDLECSTNNKGSSYEVLTKLNLSNDENSSSSDEVSSISLTNNDLKNDGWNTSRIQTDRRNTDQFYGSDKNETQGAECMDDEFNNLALQYQNTMYNDLDSNDSDYD